MPRPLVAAAALAALLCAATPSRAEDETSWATTQAAELTRQGREHAGRGDADTAARRYLDAIRFDATFGPAYLALGALHEDGGDPREAERAYSVGLDHVGRFTDAYLARARLRARLHREDEGIGDLEAAAVIRSDDVAILRELSAAYVAIGRLPAALAGARRILMLVEAGGDARGATEARVRVRALALLVADVDPVSAGLTSRGRVRHALALASRRR